MVNGEVVIENGAPTGALAGEGASADGVEEVRLELGVME